jgi:hypothetical protein
MANSSEKSIIAIHVKPPRAKTFSDFSKESIHFEDTPEGLANAQRILSTVISSDDRYKGHTFKLVRQTIGSRSQKGIKGANGVTRTPVTYYRTAPKDIPNTMLKGTEVHSNIYAETAANEAFKEKVMPFITDTQPDAREEHKSNWTHLGYSDPESMLGSRQPGETPENFIKRHSRTIANKIGTSKGMLKKWDERRNPPKKVKKGVLGTTPLEKDLANVINSEAEAKAPKGRAVPRTTTTTKAKPAAKRGRPATKGPKKTMQELGDLGYDVSETPKRADISKRQARATRSGTQKPNTLF